MPSQSDVVLVLGSLLRWVAFALVWPGFTRTRIAVAGGLVALGLVHAGQGAAAAPPDGPLEPEIIERFIKAEQPDVLPPGMDPITPAPPDSTGEENSTISTPWEPAEPGQHAGAGAWEAWISRVQGYRPYVFSVLGLIAIVAVIASNRPWRARVARRAMAPRRATAAATATATATATAMATPLRPPSPPVPALAVGDEAVLEWPGGKGVWLAVDAVARDAIRDAEERQDLEEITLLMARGRIFWEPNGTHVEVLKTPDRSAQVCVRDGSHRGAEAWVQQAFVRRVRRPSRHTAARSTNARLAPYPRGT
jgi:hypothetical protein